MLPNLPVYLPIVFGLSTLFTLVYFYYILKKSDGHANKYNIIIGGLIIWMILQMALSLNGFYTNNTMTKPPRFLLAFLPTLLFMVWVFFNKKGLAFVDSLPLVPITYLNVVRIPVEFCLYWLFLGKAVPELMTFSGRNFDIFAGLTAPFVAYFGLQKQSWSKKIVLIWNVLSLSLLINIIVNALLSAPTVLQQFAFDQPNIGVAYFPYIWLPSFIVPIVLFGHFVSIRRLWK